MAVPVAVWAVVIVQLFQSVPPVGVRAVVRVACWYPPGAAVG
ncbi:hypothetical protein [Micromonospora sp. WMMD987]|nr:hypothetical protein [Micromonospora sp. WMMD987]WFE93193.1 hypothetical protein O7612_17410 [Micromonospora sp. WMMD987]